MKTTILPLLAAILLGPQLSAQSDEQVDEIYRHYARAQETMSFSFNKQMLNAIDLDLEWENYTKEVEGDFETIRMIIFTEQAAGKRSLALIQRKLKDWGYQQIELPEDEKQENLTLLALKENGRYRHVFALIKDRDESEAMLLAFTGNLIVKNKRL